jgi:hypothetical protein
MHDRVADPNPHNAAAERHRTEVRSADVTGSGRRATATRNLGEVQRANELDGYCT